VHIHTEVRVALREGGRGNRYARCGAADVEDEDFAFGSGRGSGRLDDSADRAIGKLGKITRLPIVPGSGSEQRVEGGPSPSLEPQQAAGGPTTVGDYIEVTAMKRTFVRV